MNITLTILFFVILHSSGSVYIVDRSFKTQKFLAYDGGRVTHMKQLKQKNVLVTIGVSSKCECIILIY